MHMHCAECGSVLTLAYEADVAAKAEAYGTYGSEHDREPTGAAVRYVPPIFVVPCKVCIEKHTGPAKRMAEALKQLTSA